MLSNDLRSLHILSKTRLSIPHLLGGGQNFKCILQGGEENFLTLSLQENYIPPTHGKNDTSLKTNSTKFAHYRLKIRKVIAFSLLSVLLDAISPLQSML